MASRGLGQGIATRDAASASTKKSAAAPAWPASKPAAPDPLPGNGLAQHDFLYAGEAHAQNIYIARKGKVAWSYEGSVNKGEISDAVMLSNGNILFAHQFGVTEITPEKKVVWNYDAPPKHEIHTAVPIGKNHVLFIMNGNPAKLMVVNVETSVTEKQFTLPVGHPGTVHPQFRRVRLTDAGTALVAHLDMGKVCEYDESGKQIWSTDFRGAWSATRLANGNTLVCGNNKLVREITPQGKTAWEFTPKDIPNYKIVTLQVATRLPNGNTLLSNWVNEWTGKIDPKTAPVQLLEVTPDKKVAWALRSWVKPNLGPATTFQLLDEPSAPENVHFGKIK
jgi:hypothetical protein